MKNVIEIILKHSFAVGGSILELAPKDIKAMIHRLFSTTLLLSVLALTSCTYTTGEGPVVEKGFAKDPFRGVELEGSFDVTINQGATQNVLVVGNENIIDKLRMDVLDGILYISLEPGNYLNYELEVRLIVPTIEYVSVSGSGDIKLGTFVGIEDLVVKLDGSGDIDSEGVLEVLTSAELELDGSGDIDLKLKAESISATLDGSGDIDLSGSTSTLDVQLDGSGDIKAFKMESLVTQAYLDGSGNIDVYASKKLIASLQGSGDIRYRGEPKVEASIDGAGTIETD